MMNLTPKFRDVLGKISVALVSELDQICAYINQWSDNATLAIKELTFRSPAGGLVTDSDGHVITLTGGDIVGTLVVRSGTTTSIIVQNGAVAPKPWEGRIVACLGDGDPGLALAFMQAGVVNPTPTNITTSLARVSYFRLAVAITVAHLRWTETPTTNNNYHFAIYRAADNVRISGDHNPNMLGTDAWNAVADSFRLEANTLYYCAVGISSTTGSAAMNSFGDTTSSTTGAIFSLPTEWPGSLQVNKAAPVYPPYAYAVVPVTLGALPNPGAAPVARGAWVGGMPAIFLDAE